MGTDEDSLTPEFAFDQVGASEVGIVVDDAGVGFHNYYID